MFKKSNSQDLAYVFFSNLKYLKYLQSTVFCMSNGSYKYFLKSQTCANYFKVNKFLKFSYYFLIPEAWKYNVTHKQFILKNLKVKSKKLFKHRFFNSFEV